MTFRKNHKILILLTKLLMKEEGTLKAPKLISEMECLGPNENQVVGMYLASHARSVLGKK